MDSYQTKRTTRKAAPKKVPNERVTYDSWRPRQNVGDLSNRCIYCRRPDGSHLLVWRDGWYAMWLEGPAEGEGYVAVFDSRGLVVTEQKTIDARLANGDRKITDTEITTNQLCRRCDTLRVRGPDARQRWDIEQAVRRYGRR